ncbi:MAG: 1-acyl-sn-glycerol-3-phosphate acyltransferase [Deltaproteobacteria bacterium]|nr:1-acyl-sn-glycerol-3-phosphate acyltransferase [Deltaproteobacteria bacterium]
MVLADSDRYETPAGRPRSLLSRIFPAELAFYVPILGIVLRSSAEAKKGRYDGARWVRSSLQVVRAMEGVGMHLVIEGMEHLRSFEGPAVFVSNHMSTLETFVLPSILHPVKPVTFVVKESLVRYPVFGPIMRSRDPIQVGRKNPREDLTAVLQGGEERIGRGLSLVIFPQTTRSERFYPQRFNSLGAKLAARTNVPLVPVALRSDAWGNGRLLKDFGPVDVQRPVRFRLGAPIAARGKRNDAHAASLRFITSCLREWGCRVDEGGEVDPGETG